MEKSIAIDNVSVMPENKELLNEVLALALDLGCELLACGASVGRVEIAVERICLAYGAKEVNVFALPSMVQGSVKFSDGTQMCQMKRVYGISNNFLRLEKFNQLSRDICSERYDINECRRRLTELTKSRFAKKLTMILSAGALAAAFTVYFGGAIFDAVPSMLIGLLEMFLSTLLASRSFNGYAKTFILSLVGGVSSVLLCNLFNSLGIECHCSMVMIGAIMVVIPGLLVCNALRDMFSGDIHSGTFELLNGVLTTLVIVAGFGAPMMLFKDFALMLEAPVRVGFVKDITMFISGIFGAIAYTLMCNINLKRLWQSSVSIIITLLIYILLEEFLRDVFLDTLVATLFAATLAEVTARVVKAPSTIFLVPAIIIFVPGASMYFTLNSIVNGDAVLMSSYGTTTGLSFLAIAVGLSIIATVFQIITPKHFMNGRKNSFKSNKK